MIVTFTLNPALDRTMQIHKFIPHGVNRVVSTYTDVGGHGINVCRALKVMGTDAVACGFIGGQNGRVIKDHLANISITHDFVEVAGETRINIKIVEEDGRHTDINEAGFTITQNDLLRLNNRLSYYANRENLIAFCGAPTQNFDPEQYGAMCRHVSNRGAKLIVDTRTEYLSAALDAKPVFIKPNVSELGELLGSTVTSREDILRGARELIGRGAQNVAVSMGAQGAMFVSPGEALYVASPKIPVVGPIGAGAVMVAGICHALQNAMCFEDLAKYSVAAASASVTVAGTGMAPRREILRLFQNMDAQPM